MSRHRLPTWSVVSMALPRGYRGLPGDSTLAPPLGELRQKEPGLGKPPLNVEYILAWARPNRGHRHNAQLAFVSYAGELGQIGDSLSLCAATLSAATRRTNNFSNSSITDLGTQVTAKNPKYVNQIGFDVGMVSADGILTNGSTRTPLTAVGENRSVATANADLPSVSCTTSRAPPEGLNHVIPLPFLAAWHKIPAGG